MAGEEMPVDLKRGIVRILAADGMTTSGTGFILSEKGIIVTCSHVVQAEKLQTRGYPRPDMVEIVFRATGGRATARRVFTDLVNLGDGDLPDSRRQRRLNDLLHDQKDEKEIEAVQKVVQRLADARLVTTSRDKGEKSVQINHDSLIREWARLQRWLPENGGILGRPPVWMRAGCCWAAGWRRQRGGPERKNGI